MTTTYRVYSEGKARRAITNAKALQKKIKHIEDNNPIARLKAEIKAIETANVQVVCNKCKKVHIVKLTNYKSGKWRRVCYECFEKETYARDNDIYDQVCKLIKKPSDSRVYVGNSTPAHTITISIPTKRYNEVEDGYHLAL